MTGLEWRSGVAFAAVTMVSVLGALGTTLLLGQVASAPTQATVLAVVLALLLSRAAERGVPLGLEAGIEVVVLSVAAAGVVWLLVHQRTLGEGLLAVGLSVGILARHWSGWLRRAGRVVAQPFVAVLVTPVPIVHPASATQDLFLWSPVAALVAIAWAAAASRLVRGRALEPVERPRRASRRIDAPTRMALQMFVGLGTAMVLGRLLFDERWAWCVLSAFVVASGNQGRGDVAHKALLRLLGAAAGTLVATVGTVGVPAGQVSTLVALFAVMAAVLVLQRWSYAFWAAGMTAMLSLLHAYYGSFGQTGAEQLRERLLGVVIGSAVGVAAAWFVLPVRTTEVFRARVADCLRAVNDQDDSFPAALAALDQLTPTLRAGARHHAGARRQLAAVRALHQLPVTAEDTRLLRRDVGRIRRALVQEDDPAPDELLPELRPVLLALRPAPG